MIKKQTKRQLQAQQTKELILTKTKELLQTVSFQDISIKQICSKCDISVGTFYIYFKTKSDILLEIFLELDTVYNTLPFINDTDMSTYDKIHELILSMMNYSQNIGKQSIRNVYLAQLATDKQFLNDKNRSFFKNLINILEDGKAKGEIANHIDSDKIANKILMFIRAIIFDWVLASDDEVNLVDKAMDEIPFILGNYLPTTTKE